MMTTFPIHRPLLADNIARQSYNTGFVPENQGGGHVPAPTHRTLIDRHGYDTGFIPEYMGGSHVPDPRVRMLISGNTGIVPPFMNGSAVPARDQAIAAAKLLA